MEPWLRMLSPYLNLRMPGSGDVWMDYQPWTNWGLSGRRVGNPEIESGIFRDIAMPGKQLGKLTEAVTALIDVVGAMEKDVLAQHPEQAKALQDLKEMAHDIAQKKEELQKSAKAEALAALRRLRDADPEAFASVVDTLQTQRDGAAATKGKGRK